MFFRLHCVQDPLYVTILNIDFDAFNYTFDALLQGQSIQSVEIERPSNLNCLFPSIYDSLQLQWETKNLCLYEDDIKTIMKCIFY